MTFLISNKPLGKCEKLEDLYVIGDYVRKGSHILFINGYFFTENNMDLDSIFDQFIEKGINFLNEINGQFCGVYYNIEKKQVFFFTDKFGHFDLFFYYDNESIIISDKFSEILLLKEFSYNDIDIQSIYEFMIFECPLFEKTFIKTIRFLSIGTFYEFNITSHSLEKTQYFNYTFKIPDTFDVEENYTKLDKLYEIAIQRVKKINPPNAVYGLGLSGGMDSRVVAYYAKKNDLKLKTFIFGNEKSDAYKISKKLAKLLKTEHYEIGYYRDFFEFAEESMEFNPMMNIQYVWYHAIYKNLPKFDVLLTGYGGYVLGGLLQKAHLNIENDRAFSELIFNKYCDIGSSDWISSYFNISSKVSDIKDSIVKYSQTSTNPEYWQKDEEFNCKYRNRIYIKNTPAFNHLGLYQSYSILVDPDVLEFALTIPGKVRANRMFLYNFLKKKIPILVKVRPERKIPSYSDNKILNTILLTIYHADRKLGTHFFFKKSHKRVWDWVSNYQPFLKFLENTFSQKNKKFDDIFNVEMVSELVSKQSWSRPNVSLLFRFITIKLFLDRIVN